MLFIVIPVVGFIAVAILIFIAWYIMVKKKGIQIAPSAFNLSIVKINEL